MPNLRHLISSADPARKKLKETADLSHRRNGNVKELKSMASEPKDEHCFILESFKEFEALARRALHQGALRWWYE